MNKLVSNKQATEAFEHLMKNINASDYDINDSLVTLSIYLEENKEDGLKENLGQLIFWGCSFGILLFLISYLL